MAVTVTTAFSQSSPTSERHESEASPNWIERIENANRSSIVFITAEASTEHGLVKSLSGTGFVVDSDGHILTCSHVIPKSGEYGGRIKITGAIGTSNDEHPYKLYFTKRDEPNDLVLLQLPASVPAKPVQSVGKAGIGTPIVAFGFPQGKDLLPAKGIITATTSEGGNWLTDAQINPGMSGGPVFNGSGEVVAIVVAGEEEANAINHVIPISFSENLLRNIDCPLLSARATPIPSQTEKEPVDPQLIAERVWPTLVNIGSLPRKPYSEELEKLIPDALLPKDKKERGIMFQTIINKWQDCRKAASCPPVRGVNALRRENLKGVERFYYKLDFFPSTDQFNRPLSPPQILISVDIGKSGQLIGWSFGGGWHP
jgi:hypothetical protein